MPAGATVKYKNGAKRMIAVQVFAGPESADKYGAWQTSPDPPPHFSSHQER